MRVQGCKVPAGSRAEPRPEEGKGVQRINPLVRIWASTRPSGFEKEGRAKRAKFLAKGAATGRQIVLPRNGPEVRAAVPRRKF